MHLRTLLGQITLQCSPGSSCYVLPCCRRRSEHRRASLVCPDRPVRSRPGRVHALSHSGVDRHRKRLTAGILRGPAVGKNRLGRNRHSDSPQHRRGKNLGGPHKTSGYRWTGDSQSGHDSQEVGPRRQGNLSQPRGHRRSNRGRSFSVLHQYARCFYTRSDDDGKTFAKPREITAAFAAFRPEYDWQVLATGPGHGIQLKNNRLLVPVWLSTGAVGAVTGRRASPYWSATTAALVGSAARSFVRTLTLRTRAKPPPCN